MKVVLTDEALQSLNDVYDYISLDNEKNAKKTLQEIIKTINILETFPNSGGQPEYDELVEKGYKKLVSGNYVILYVIMEEYVEVRLIIQGSRDYLNFIK